jgi:YaiO family outer membrane protein
MFGALLLTTLLAGPAGDAQASQVPTHAEAAELARQGDEQAAMDAYRRLAAANPRDHQARLGIARLHLAMGHPELAEPVFRSVLLEDPKNTEAMLGVGSSLSSLGRLDEALIELDRAAQAAPGNADALAALGVTHLRASNTTLAVSYLEQAVATTPTPENMRALEDARRAHGHSVQLGGLFEGFDNGSDDTWGGDLTVNVRLKDRLRLIARGQLQDKFGVSDARGGAGLEWRWRPDASLYVHGLGGPDNLVLPRAEGRLALSYRPGAVAWTAAVQVMDFSTATLSTVSPEMTWWTSDRASIGLRYTLSLTSLDGSDDLTASSSGALTTAYRVNPRTWFNLGYAIGIEDFDALSVDRIGRFSAHTVTGGLRVDLRTLTTLLGTYQYQWRSGDETLNRVVVALRQSF